MPASIVNISEEKGEKFTGFLALPDSGSGPGIVVIQEIFGVNFVMREVCHTLAAQGYVAICPDLFWSLEPSVELCDKTDGEWAKAFDFYKKFNVDQGISDLDITIIYLRSHSACTGKIGAVGYCLGGKLAYLMATRTNVDCSVGYYGVGIGDDLDESTNIKFPHMQHVAEEDQFVPKEEQQKIIKGLSSIEGVTVHSYPGVDHAFARINGAHYDQKSSDLANSRTSDFFNEHLT